MKLPLSPKAKILLVAALLCLGLASAAFIRRSQTRASAQNTETKSRAENSTVPPERANTNATPPANLSSQTNTIGQTNALSQTKAASQTNAASPAATPSANAASSAIVSESQPPKSVTGALPPAQGDAQPKAEPEKTSAADEIPLSFQGAQIDMVVQWLAKTTGKSVVKHPRVQCQLTIVSSKNLPSRDAINLVYRALALEGFTTIESSKSILIVPEGQEPKMNPELIETARGEIPQGRQRLIKVFPLKYIQPAELKEKVRSVLSEKGTIEADERANQLIVTDYNDNLRLLAELVKELDVTSVSDSVIEIYSLKYSQAEDLANLLSLILNAQSAGATSQGKAAPPPGGGGPMPGGPPSMPGGGGPPPGGAAQASPQQVRLWPDKTANRLIVVAPKSKLPEIKELIAVLDTDKPEDVGVRVIPLKNVSAEDLVKEIGPLYQKAGSKSVKDMIEVTASSRANSLIVLSSEANFKAIEKLISKLDTEDAQEKVMQAFALKNADAEDVAKQLKDLSQDQDSQSRYPYYFFSSSSSGKSSKKMNVVSDRRRNTVIVQAPPGSMEGIEKMIKTLDEPVTDNSLAPKIYPLKYVSAVDIEDILNELFLKKQQPQRPYWYYEDNPQETANRDVGRLYGKVRIISEPYSNSIIVTSNSPENLAAVEDVLKQLDVRSQAGESTLRVGLRFAKASTVANSINILFAKNGSPPLRQVNQAGQPQPNPQQEQQQRGGSSQSNFELEQDAKEEGYFPWIGGQQDNPRTSDGRTIRTVSDLVGRVRVVPDQRSNALLISANVQFFTQVLKLIEDLDAPTAEVLIEARIVEVSSDFLDKLGVRWSPDGSKVFSADDFNNSILAHVGAKYTTGFGGNTTVNTPASSLLPQALASLRSGMLDSMISMDFLIQFLRQNTEASVLAQPQINIKDNETGKLFVGQQVPFIDNSIVPATGGQSQSFTYKDVGVILEVTPHINTSGDVSLKIHAESSAIVPGQTILGGALIDTRNFKTDLEAKSGQTIVLGGIIQRQVSDTMRKTPILGSIPGLGWAFKKKDKISREVELMVFLRPKVVRTPEEAKELLEEVDKKAPLVKKWKDESEEKKNSEEMKK